jgi:glycine C-acetyltransferase
MAAFEILDQEPDRLVRLWENTLHFKQSLADAGFDTGASETPITPVLVGDAAAAHRFSRELFDEGVYCTGIGYPTVPQGKARIRTIVTATHSTEMLDRAVETLAKVAKRLQILR